MYRDYELITTELVTPPFTDCANLIASTQYIYGITAVSSAIREEGEMATGVFFMTSLSTPQSPAVVQVDSASTWLNVTISPACDAGGTVLPSYFYTLHRKSESDVPVRAAQFACCSVLVDSLVAATEYVVSVYASNAFSQSATSTRDATTLTGVPTAPSIRLKRANTYSLSFEIERTSPANPEIESHEVDVYQSGSVIHSETLACAFAANARYRECPQSFVIRSLSPLTLYSVEVRARGPTGDSEPSYADFETTNESPGTFALETTTDLASASGAEAATVAVRREGGTAGSASIGVDISEPAGLVLHCVALANGEQRCDVHLASSGVPNSPAVLNFEDGEESKTVGISMRDEDYSFLEQVAVVLQLVGDSSRMGSGSQRSVLVRIDQSQQRGFAAFSSSSMEVWENASFAKLDIVRLNGSSGALTVNVETFNVGDTASSALYLPVNQSVHFSDRQTRASVWVRLLNDIYYEGGGTLGVRLVNENASTAVQLSFNSIITKKVLVLDDEDASRVLPKIPENVREWRSTGGEIEIRWQAPSNADSALVRGYLVRVVQPGLANSHFELFNVTQSEFTLSSLPPWTLYQFEVAAWNVFGAGPFTTGLQTGTTGFTPPGAPIVRMYSSSCSTITVQWREPRDSGGSQIAGYIVKLETSFGDKYGVGYLAANASATLSFTLTQLNASTPYRVFISAVSVAFPVIDAALEQFGVVNGITASGILPSAPPKVTLLSPPAAGVLSLQMRLPIDFGGLPLLDYALYIRRASVDPQDPASGAFSVACTRSSPLVGGVPYTCNVYALLSDSSYEVYATFTNALVRHPSLCEKH